MAKPTYRRSKKLIKPKVQLKIAFACLGIAVMSVIVLMILINEVILDFADKGWIDAGMLQNEWMGVLMTKMAIALAILAPMTLAIGVILMHRVAGPIYRFEVFLRQVVRGEHERECRIRKGDELVEMCTLLNQFTAPLRDGSVDRTPFAKALDEGASLTEASHADEAGDVSEDAPAESPKRVPALES